MSGLFLQITVARSPSTLFHTFGATKCAKLSSISTFSPLKRSSSSRKSKPFVKCQLSDLAPATSAAYGVLLLSGGIFAFSKSKSKGSLFGGLTGSALMATTYFLMQDQETRAIADALGFGSAFLFSCVFGIRLAATRKLIPSGLLLGISISALAVFISSYFQDKI